MNTWGCCRARRIAALLIGVALLTPGRHARGAAYPEPPQAVFQELFAAVQTARVFPDGKEFADAIPKVAPQRILADYRRQNRAATS